VVVIQNNLKLILETFLFEFMTDEVIHRIKHLMSAYMDTLVLDNTIREYLVQDTSEVGGVVSFDVFYRPTYGQYTTVLHITMGRSNVNRTSIIKHYIPTHNLIK
jgi:hypothetical protein